MTAAGTWQCKCGTSNGDSWGHCTHCARKRRGRTWFSTWWGAAVIVVAILGVFYLATVSADASDRRKVKALREAHETDVKSEQCLGLMEDPEAWDAAGCPEFYVDAIVELEDAGYFDD